MRHSATSLQNDAYSKEWVTQSSTGSINDPVDRLVICFPNVINHHALVNVNERVGRHVHDGQCGDMPHLMHSQGQHGR
jgi:hypothetical protein